ncbi:DNA mismatch repair endonuclease MutL [Saprospiraceae bacterium]|nr:DNA mismatch repair endonuclease MutL [Saprospiraceae bacterium]
MSNIIQLLPDSIANQIAAGEVVQRPSSAVKELLENSIDAGSKSIKLILKSAGKTLMQVIDDGKGMSEMDARMCFERHATSKIRNSEDLFQIQTMGFRGEAMASIAAVAQVELITKEHDADLGTKIVIAGSKITTQEPCQAPNGSSIAIKNLFFNVPARRKFLKSEATEYKHILDEFHRIVLCYPEIKFSLFHNNNEIYHLPASNLRQRIVNVFGKPMNEKLVPLEESTDVLGIGGFIMKPQFARKSRGDQYIFVNKRFIKSNYMNHAVRFAFESLIPGDTHPGFFIYLDVDPAKIDVNVHPTKQEIKFEEERLIYNYIKVAVRHALGKHNLTPTLDFDASNFNAANIGGSGGERSSGSSMGFTKEQYDKREKENLKNWESLYDGLIEIQPKQDDFMTARGSVANTSPTNKEDNMFTVPSRMSHDTETASQETLIEEQRQLFQLHNRYILTPIKSGFILIDQKAAHERILYEDYLKAYTESKKPTQKSLFPETIQFSAGQAEIFRNVMEQINFLGWEIEDFGNNSFIIQGIPEEMQKEFDIKLALESLMEDITLDKDVQKRQETIARKMAASMSITKAQKLTVEEMQSLVDRLFACEHPYLSPRNKSVISTFTMEEILQRFNIAK